MLDIIHLLDYPGLVYIRNMVTDHRPSIIPNISSYIAENPGTDFKGILNSKICYVLLIYIIHII